MNKIQSCPQFHLSIILFMFLMMINTHSTQAQTIIPEPVIREKSRGSFTLKGSVDIFIPANNEKMRNNAAFLADLLEPLNDVALAIKMYNTSDPVPSGGILLAIDESFPQPDQYVLDIASRQITIHGKTPRAVFYGIQSLRQLLPAEIEDKRKAALLKNVKIGNGWIEDYPQFPYRGMHLDVGRHFFPVDFIKKYIDLLSMHKMNTFHWHLTEDQGWRIEIKKYPKLTEVGAWRKETLIGHYNDQPRKFDGKPYGGFYTQDEVKEVLAFAASRHVTVIPEIELPGHALAALASYPELGCTKGPYEVQTYWGIFEDAFCAGSEQTFDFLENVLDEVAALFPSEYIHIGGDECLKNRWKECDACQARIHNEGLADEHELQSYFIKRVADFLQTRQKKIIGWDEILEGGLAPSATVMSWRGFQGGIEAARNGHDVIMTPTSFCYFDFYQADPDTEPLAIGGYTTLQRVYSFNPVPEELSPQQAKHILGGQGNVWTEYMKTSDHVEYMAYPRAVALAEVLWSPRNKHDFQDFEQRLKNHLDRFDMLQVNYFDPFR